MEEGDDEQNAQPLSLEPKATEEVKQAVTPPKEAEDLSKKDTSKMTKKERKQHVKDSFKILHKVISLFPTEPQLRRCMNKL